MKEPRGTTLFRLARCIRGVLLLMIASAALAACAARPAGDLSSHNPGAAAAALAESSRDAGLLTDWHLMGRYGTGKADFARTFAPERWASGEAAEAAAWAAKAAAKPDADIENEPAERHFRNLRYELLFPDGTFVLPPALAGRSGVFYAVSRVYLSDAGEWNLYLESGAEAVVFFDGSPVLTRGAADSGAQRETLHTERGYHLVMIKFVARSAPFRVAILPPNSGSRRKNSTPYLDRQENLNAAERGLHRHAPASGLTRSDCVVEGDHAAALGVLDKLLAQAAERGEDLAGTVDVVGSVVPDGFEVLRILAGEQRYSARNRGKAQAAAS